MIRILFALYHLAWLAALPVLRRFPRVSLGWFQRTLQHVPDGPFDLWIQSASGGESLLTNALLAELGARLPIGTSLRILTTSGTKQGVDSLEKGCPPARDNSPLHVTVRYFPFDDPHLMAKAISLFSPRLIVLLETELWPGLLHAAKQHQIPVLLLNGRMSRNSHRRYRHLRWLFTPLCPERIWAISPEDSDRFGEVMGSANIRLMNNIKFDRIETQRQPVAHPELSNILPPQAIFVLLGSIRREEEEKITATIVGLLQARQDIVIGVFPKHIERADLWLEKLGEKNITAIKRSQAEGACSPGSVLVWDVFGELAGAYGLARVTFIGGSLVDLGGQNFLEPLVFGLRPFIGPYWTNFAWVSREIVDGGLVREVADEKQLLAELLLALDTEESRDLVIEQVQHFLASRKGGTRLGAQEIYNFLFPGSENNT